MYAVKTHYYLQSSSVLLLAQTLICCCRCKRKMQLAHESCKYIAAWRLVNHWWKIWPFVWPKHYAGCGSKPLKLVENRLVVCWVYSCW